LIWGAVWAVSDRLFAIAARRILERWLGKPFTDDPDNQNNPKGEI
jgi:hypothetical protein